MALSAKTYVIKASLDHKQHSKNPLGDFGGATGAGDTAIKLFEQDMSGTNNEPLYQGSDSPYSDAGWYSFFLPNGAGPGTGGINKTSMFVTPVSDSAYPNVTKGLRNIYLADGSDIGFTNHVWHIYHPETRKFYMRWRMRFSPNWEWGSDQLKFCKNGSPAEGNGYVGDVSVNCPHFHANKVEITNQSGEVRNIYPATGYHIDASYNVTDDINNKYGVNDTDVPWPNGAPTDVPLLAEWGTWSMELDCGTPGKADGHIILYAPPSETQPYMQIENLHMMNEGATAFIKHEFGGHVWQTGSPTQDIWLEFHSLEVYDKTPGVIEAAPTDNIYTSWDGAVDTDWNAIVTHGTQTYISTDTAKNYQGNARSIYMDYTSTTANSDSCFFNLKLNAGDSTNGRQELWITFAYAFPDGAIDCDWLGAYGGRDSWASNYSRTVFHPKSAGEIAIMHSTSNSRTNQGVIDDTLFAPSGTWSGTNGTDAPLADDQVVYDKIGALNSTILDYSGTWRRIGIHLKPSEAKNKFGIFEIWSDYSDGVSVPFQQVFKVSGIVNLADGIPGYVSLLFGGLGKSSSDTVPQSVYFDDIKVSLTDWPVKY